MRMAIPLARSSSVTRPKSSVTPARVLHGDRQMDSPWRRESGRPNLHERSGLSERMVKGHLQGSYCQDQEDASELV